MINQEFKRGDIVKLARPYDEQEACILMQVREDRGERVLVHSLTIKLEDFAINPSFVFLKNELELVRAACD